MFALTIVRCPSHIGASHVKGFPPRVAPMTKSQSDVECFAQKPHFGVRGRPLVQTIATVFPIFIGLQRNYVLRNFREYGQSAKCETSLPIPFSSSKGASLPFGVFQN